MGIDSFNIAPDNKGGRPSKEEQEEEETVERYSGRVYVASEADENWWKETINELFGGIDLHTLDKEELRDKITELSDFTHTNPVEIRKELEEHKLIGDEWEEYVEQSPDHTLDGRVPGVEGPTDTKSYSPSFSSSSKDDTPEGLQSIIDAAK